MKKYCIKIKFKQIQLVIGLLLMVSFALKVSAQKRTTIIDHSIENSISLNGDWEFAITKDMNAAKWDVLPVPASWNTYTEYADYVGEAWYKKTILVPNWTRIKL